MAWTRWLTKTEPAVASCLRACWPKAASLVVENERRVKWRNCIGARRDSAQFVIAQVGQHLACLSV